MRYLFILLLVTVAGCSTDTKRKLGIHKETPDEYAVMERPPLYVPPTFDSKDASQKPAKTQAKSLSGSDKNFMKKLSTKGSSADTPGQQS